MAETTTPAIHTMTPDELRGRLTASAFAYRGYNVTNLGLTPELMEQGAYRPFLEKYLKRAAHVCSRVKGRKVDLVRRVDAREETSLATYDEAVSMIVAVEIAHIEILRNVFDVDISQARVAYGFSLGEITALVGAGIIELEDALRIPIEMSDDCVDLANDVTLAVLFSRRGELSTKTVSRVCQEINAEGRGVIGVSAWLAPNSMLVIGQRDTLDELQKRKAELSDERVFIRRNDQKWPPLHTPIMWQRAIPNRSQHLMHTMPTERKSPVPPIFSMVTGKVSYDDENIRDTIGDWVDHPQQLWQAVDYTLSEGIELVIHVGPQPNIIPATFERLSANVASQTKDSVGMRALSGIANRPWLNALLPRRASLLRATKVAHIKVEDWLLENAPK